MGRPAAINGTIDAAAGYSARYRVTSGGNAWTQVAGISASTATTAGLGAGTAYDF